MLKTDRKQPRGYRYMSSSELSLFPWKSDDLRGNVRGNFFGGVTAAVVALPLALAFGIASGLGPAAGLMGAITLGAVATIFGGTRTQISGPTGPMTVVVASLFLGFGGTDDQSAVALVLTTIMLGGLFQMAFGLARLGKYFVMVPYPVISGFMSGIGLIIIVLQLAPLVGAESSSGILQALALFPAQLQAVNPTALLMGLFTLALLFLWPASVNRYLPGPLAALILGIICSNLLTGQPMPTIGAIPSLLPSLHFPVMNHETLEAVITGAITLAVLGTIDSLLTSLVSENMTGEPHNSDQELVGQGIGNMFSGFLGGLPGAGATMRTVVNIQSGGDRPSSGFIHAAILLVSAVGVGFVFKEIPLSVLAAILVKVGVDIIDWPFIQRVFRLSPFSVFLMLLVLLLTVFSNLIIAVLVGVFIKNVVTLEKLSTLQLGELVIAPNPESSELLTSQQAEYLDKQDGKVILVKLNGPMSYSVARGLTQRFSTLPGSEKLVIDLSEASIVGTTSALALENLIQSAIKNGTQVCLIDPRGSSHKELVQIGIMELVPPEQCYSSFELYLSAQMAV